MGERTVILQGFEEGLAGEIAARFTFTATPPTNAPLGLGRNLFVDFMPERDDIKKTSPEFNPEKEAVVAIYNAGGASVGATVSSGSRHEWNLRIAIRFGTVFEAAKELLEQLVAWLERSLRGRPIGRHYVKGVFITARPSPFQRTGDAQAYCTATVRILAVPRANL